MMDNPFIQNFINSPPDILAWKIFWLIGWLPLAIIMLWGAKEVWLVYIRTKWGKEIKYIILAVDIPRNNMQSPKAVENMLSYLAGAHSDPNIIEKYWIGVFQLSFSLEIVSIDGYVQFLIWTPEKFRNLVESAVYSQYPDAEISEVNDYTDTIPRRYPDAEYEVWGAEYVEKLPSAYPIKTYKEFEHIFGEPETVYKDPMASLMDLFSSLKKGEQAWYQIILIPIGFTWPKIGDAETSKILKEKTGGGNIIDNFGDTILEWFNLFSDAIFSTGEYQKTETKDEPLKMLNLKPKEKKQVESIQEKCSKLGFEVKIRFVYAGKKEIFNKPKVVNGFTGYIKQFASLDLNNLKPDMDVTATKADFFFKQQILNTKKTRIVNYYRRRDDTSGRKPFILNIEELASIWHFPIESVVKAPLIQKAPGRKAEAPMSLPTVDESETDEFIEPIFGAAKKKPEEGASPLSGPPPPEFAKKAAPPENLPVA